MKNDCIESIEYCITSYRKRNVESLVSDENEGMNGKGRKVGWSFFTVFLIFHFFGFHLTLLPLTKLFLFKSFSFKITLPVKTFLVQPRYALHII